MRTTVVVAFFSCCSVVLSNTASPQDSTKQSEQPKNAPRTAAKDDLTVTGCLQKGAEPRTLVLHNTEAKGPKLISIVDSKVDLQGFLGLKIEIVGSPVTDKEVAAMKTKPSKGDRYMRVRAAKLITTACP